MSSISKIKLPDGKSYDFRDANGYNPNLLDNPDFAINQRGTAVYTVSSATPKPTVDRWNAQGVMQLTVGDGVTVKVTEKTSSALTFLSQKVPFTFVGDDVSVTLSVSGTSSKANLYVDALDSSGSTLKHSISLATDSIKSVTLEGIPADTVMLRVRLDFPANTAANSECHLKWVKLEIGDHATPFVPPNPVLELAKCQRYLLKINAFEAFRAVYVLPGYVDFSIPTPVTMRSGTISIDGDFSIYPFPIAAAVSGFTAVIQVYGQNQLRLRATKTAHGLTDAVLTIPDSKFMLLSNEL